MKLLSKLKSEGLIHPPDFLPDNVHYVTIMGSFAYNVSHDTSDMDIYGFCIPPKDVVFPHLAGIIPGFGNQGRKFDQWQEHHISYGDKEYDFSIYSIVRYFHLAMENNPNMIDSLFTAENCLLHCTNLGRHVRANRHLFLHKGAYHKFTGYAHSQLKKIRTKEAQGKRKVLVEQFGYDVKFAYHLLRLTDEIEQILSTGNLILGRNNEELKAIRRGEFTLEKLEAMFESRMRHIEELYQSSTLQHSPDEGAIKALLLECLEMHYGRIDNIVRTDRTSQLIGEIQSVLGRYV
jgi:predicted nucleotidyltransferase